MAAVDVAPIVSRIATLIGALPAIGRVIEHEVFDRDDWAPQLVSVIDGVPTLRGWLITGPTLTEAQYFTQSHPANAIRRAWAYRVLGIEGVDAQAATAFATMRANLVAVIDALDADRNMGGSAHQCRPCTLEAPPELRQINGNAAVVYVEVTKIVVTVSSP